MDALHRVGASRIGYGRTDIHKRTALKNWNGISGREETDMFNWLFRRKKMEEAKNWVVFNRGENLEFAECPVCGHEVDPDKTILDLYPGVCPKCGAILAGTVDAEEG